MGILDTVKGWFDFKKTKTDAPKDIGGVDKVANDLVYNYAQTPKFDNTTIGDISDEEKKKKEIYGEDYAMKEVSGSTYKTKSILDDIEDFFVDTIWYGMIRPAQVSAQTKREDDLATNIAYDQYKDKLDFLKDNEWNIHPNTKTFIEQGNGITKIDFDQDGNIIGTKDVVEQDGFVPWQALPKTTNRKKMDKIQSGLGMKTSYTDIFGNEHLDINIYQKTSILGEEFVYINDLYTSGQIDKATTQSLAKKIQEEAAFEYERAFKGTGLLPKDYDYEKSWSQMFVLSHFFDTYVEERNKFTEAEKKQEKLKKDMEVREMEQIRLFGPESVNKKSNVAIESEHYIDTVYTKNLGEALKKRMDTVETDLYYNGKKIDIGTVSDGSSMILSHIKKEVDYNNEMMKSYQDLSEIVNGPNKNMPGYNRAIEIYTEGMNLYLDYGLFFVENMGKKGYQSEEEITAAWEKSRGKKFREIFNVGGYQFDMYNSDADVLAPSYMTRRDAIKHLYDNDYNGSFAERIVHGISKEYNANNGDFSNKVIKGVGAVLKVLPKETYKQLVSSAATGFDWVIGDLARKVLGVGTDRGNRMSGNRLARKLDLDSLGTNKTSLRKSVAVCIDQLDYVVPGLIEFFLTRKMLGAATKGFKMTALAKQVKDPRGVKELVNAANELSKIKNVKGFETWVKANKTLLRSSEHFVDAANKTFALTLVDQTVVLPAIFQSGRFGGYTDEDAALDILFGITLDFMDAVRASKRALGVSKYDPIGALMSENHFVDEMSKHIYSNLESWKGFDGRDKLNDAERNILRSQTRGYMDFIAKEFANMRKGLDTKDFDELMKELEKLADELQHDPNTFADMVLYGKSVYQIEKDRKDALKKIRDNKKNELLWSDKSKEEIATKNGVIQNEDGTITYIGRTKQDAFTVNRGRQPTPDDPYKDATHYEYFLNHVLPKGNRHIVQDITEIEIMGVKYNVSVGEFKQVGKKTTPEFAPIYIIDPKTGAKTASGMGFYIPPNKPLDVNIGFVDKETIERFLNRTVDIPDQSKATFDGNFSFLVTPKRNTTEQIVEGLSNINGANEIMNGMLHDIKQIYKNNVEKVSKQLDKIKDKIRSAFTGDKTKYASKNISKIISETDPVVIGYAANAKDVNEFKRIIMNPKTEEEKVVSDLFFKNSKDEEEILKFIDPNDTRPYIGDVYREGTPGIKTVEGNIDKTKPQIIFDIKGSDGAIEASVREYPLKNSIEDTFTAGQFFREDYLRISPDNVSKIDSIIKKIDDYKIKKSKINSEIADIQNELKEKLVYNVVFNDHPNMLGFDTLTVGDKKYRIEIKPVMVEGEDDIAKIQKQGDAVKKRFAEMDTLKRHKYYLEAQSYTYDNVEDFVKAHKPLSGPFDLPKTYDDFIKGKDELFHGSRTEDIYKFSTLKDKVNRKENIEGIYFTKNPSEAKKYGSNIHRGFTDLSSLKTYKPGDEIPKAMLDEYESLIKTKVPNADESYIAKKIDSFKKSIILSDVLDGAEKGKLLKKHGYDAVEDGRHVVILNEDKIKTISELKQDRDKILIDSMFDEKELRKIRNENRALTKVPKDKSYTISIIKDEKTGEKFVGTINLKQNVPTTEKSKQMLKWNMTVRGQDIEDLFAEDLVVSKTTKKSIEEVPVSLSSSKFGSYVNKSQSYLEISVDVEKGTSAAKRSVIANREMNKLLVKIDKLSAKLEFYYDNMKNAWDTFTKSFPDFKGTDMDEISKDFYGIINDLKKDYDDLVNITDSIKFRNPDIVALQETKRVVSDQIKGAVTKMDIKITESLEKEIEDIAYVFVLYKDNPEVILKHIEGLEIDPRIKNYFNDLFYGDEFWRRPMPKKGYTRKSLDRDLKQLYIAVTDSTKNPTMSSVFGKMSNEQFNKILEIYFAGDYKDIPDLIKKIEAMGIDMHDISHNVVEASFDSVGNVRIQRTKSGKLKDVTVRELHYDLYREKIIKGRFTEMSKKEMSEAFHVIVDAINNMEKDPEFMKLLKGYNELKTNAEKALYLQTNFIGLSKDTPRYRKDMVGRPFRKELRNYKRMLNDLKEIIERSYGKFSYSDILKEREAGVKGIATFALEAKMRRLGIVLDLGDEFMNKDVQSQIYEIIGKVNSTGPDLTEEHFKQLAYINNIVGDMLPSDVREQMKRMFNRSTLGKTEDDIILKNIRDDLKSLSLEDEIKILDSEIERSKKILGIVEGDMSAINKYLGGYATKLGRLILPQVKEFVGDLYFEHANIFRKILNNNIGLSNGKTLKDYLTTSNRRDKNISRNIKKSDEFIEDLVNYINKKTINPIRGGDQEYLDILKEVEGKINKINNDILNYLAPHYGDSFVKSVRDKILKIDKDHLEKFTDILEHGDWMEYVRFANFELFEKLSIDHNFANAIWGTPIADMKVLDKASKKAIKKEIKHVADSKKVVDDKHIKLYNEAKKYDNVDEFVNAQGKKLYRGQESLGKETSHNTTRFAGDTEGGVFFTPHKSEAQKFGNVIDIVTTKDKILTIKESDELQKMATDIVNSDLKKGIESDHLIEQMALGRPRAFAEYSGKPFIETGDKFGIEGELLYYKEFDQNPVSESQLREIREKANAKTESVKETFAVPEHEYSNYYNKKRIWAMNTLSHNNVTENQIKSMNSFMHTILGKTGRDKLGKMNDWKVTKFIKGVGRFPLYVLSQTVGKPAQAIMLLLMNAQGTIIDPIVDAAHMFSSNDLLTLRKKYNFLIEAGEIHQSKGGPLRQYLDGELESVKDLTKAIGKRAGEIATDSARLGLYNAYEITFDPAFRNNSIAKAIVDETGTFNLKEFDEFMSKLSKVDQEKIISRIERRAEDLYILRTGNSLHASEGKFLYGDPYSFRGLLKKTGGRAYHFLSARGNQHVKNYMRLLKNGSRKLDDIYVDLVVRYGREDANVLIKDMLNKNKDIVAFTQKILAAISMGEKMSRNDQRSSRDPRYGRDIQDVISFGLAFFAPAQGFMSSAYGRQLINSFKSLIIDMGYEGVEVDKTLAFFVGATETMMSNMGRRMLLMNAIAGAKGEMDMLKETGMASDKFYMNAWHFLGSFFKNLGAYTEGYTTFLSDEVINKGYKTRVPTTSAMDLDLIQPDVAYFKEEYWKMTTINRVKYLQEDLREKGPDALWTWMQYKRPVMKRYERGKLSAESTGLDEVISDFNRTEESYKLRDGKLPWNLLNDEFTDVVFNHLIRGNLKSGYKPKELEDGTTVSRWTNSMRKLYMSKTGKTIREQQNQEDVFFKYMREMLEEGKLDAYVKEFNRTDNDGIKAGLRFLATVESTFEGIVPGASYQIIAGLTNDLFREQYNKERYNAGYKYGEEPDEWKDKQSSVIRKALVTMFGETLYTTNVPYWSDISRYVASRILPEHKNKFTAADIDKNSVDEEGKSLYYQKTYYGTKLAYETTNRKDSLSTQMWDAEIYTSLAIRKGVIDVPDIYNAMNTIIMAKNDKHMSNPVIQEHLLNMFLHLSKMFNDAPITEEARLNGHVGLCMAFQPLYSLIVNNKEAEAVIGKETIDKVANFFRGTLDDVNGVQMDELKSIEINKTFDMLSNQDWDGPKDKPTGTLMDAYKKNPTSTYGNSSGYSYNRPYRDRFKYYMQQLSGARPYGTKSYGSGGSYYNKDLSAYFYYRYFFKDAKSRGVTVSGQDRVTRMFTTKRSSIKLPSKK